MKKFLFLFFFYPSFFVQAQTSIYHPFPDSNAVWTEWWNGGLMAYGEIYSYVLGADTVISSNIYHKIYLNNLIRIGDTTQFPPIHLIGYKGCIRQNTVTKKIYFIIPNDTSQRLLFDFNVQLGDTVNTYAVEDDFSSLGIVSNMDSVLVGSSYRKQWLITDGVCGYYVIEGIGNSTGLLERYSCPFPDGPWNYLMCYQQDSVSLYAYSNNWNNCSMLMSIDQQELKSSVSLSPNPATNEFVVSSSKFGEIESIEIYSSVGEKVLFQMINVKSQISIDVSQLPSGIYFIIVTDQAGNKVTNKVVKM